MNGALHERLTLRSEIFDNWKPFKNSEKYFFHIKSSSRSQDI